VNMKAAATREKLWIAVQIALCLGVGVSGQAGAQAVTGDDSGVLIEVNGEPITSADLEMAIMDAHRAGLSVDQQKGLVPRLLQKAVRDRLILQDAFAMGMGDDPTIAGPIEEEAIRKAISLYARSKVDLPEVSDDEVRDYFDQYYHRIQLRQISLASPDECGAAMHRINRGEVSMGTLATEISLDGLKSRGGLNKDLYWADLDFALRAAAESLEVGEFSDPFEFNGNRTFIRVESRTPPDEAEFVEREEFIRLTIRNQKYEDAWKALVADHVDGVEVQVNEDVMAGIKADEDILYRGEFKVGTEAPLLVIDPGHVISERQFRLAMSTTAMEMGTSTFEEILERVINDQTEILVLALYAERAGFYEDPEVVDYYQSRLEAVVLNAYLKEYIADRIFFDRDEFRQFYEDHADDFRGPEEVRLSILTSDEEAVVQEAARRLKGGVDFDYLRAEIEGRDVDLYTESPSWSPVSVFSEQIATAAVALEVGQTSEPLPFGRSWLIFRLDGRRQGSVPPMEMVDGAIREALYNKQFAALLDEHLARLEEASVIVRHEDRIKAWAEDEG